MDIHRQHSKPISGWDMLKYRFPLRIDSTPFNPNSNGKLDLFPFSHCKQLPMVQQTTSLFFFQIQEIPLYHLSKTSLLKSSMTAPVHQLYFLVFSKLDRVNEVLCIYIYCFHLQIQLGCWFLFLFFPIYPLSQNVAVVSFANIERTTVLNYESCICDFLFFMRVGVHIM